MQRETSKEFGLEDFDSLQVSPVFSQSADTLVRIILAFTYHNNQQTLEEFVLSKIKDIEISNKVIILLKENELESVDDFYQHIHNSDDLIQMLGLDEVVAKKLFAISEEEVLEEEIIDFQAQIEKEFDDFGKYIFSKVNSFEITAKLLQTLKELEIESREDFDKEIYDYKQMVNFCGISEDIANLFFTIEKQKLTLQYIQKLFPISSNFVYQALNDANIQFVEQLQHLPLDSRASNNLKNYQILRLKGQQADQKEIDIFIKLLEDSIKDSAEKQKFQNNFFSDGANQLSVFEQSSDEELKQFGLKMIQIKRILLNLRNFRQTTTELQSIAEQQIYSSQLLLDKTLEEQKEPQIINDQQQKPYNQFYQSQQSDKAASFSHSFKQTAGEDTFIPLDLVEINQQEADIEEAFNYQLIEELKALIQDHRGMPTSFIKTIINIIEIVAIKCYGNLIGFQNNDHIENDVLLTLQTQFEELQIQKREESQDFQDDLTNIYIQIQGESWQIAITYSLSLLKKAMPLNLQLLFRLIQNIQHSAKLLNQQDIILLMGGTGAGKSTTIHFLAGSKIIKTQINGISHLMPIEYKNKSLDHVKCNPFSQSETKYITPVLINLKELGLDDDVSLILCDSPGFDDSAGEEVDIANGVGIIKAIQNCKTVRPVIVLSAKSIGDKGQGIKHIAKIITGMMPSISENIGSFTYYFTKFSEEAKKEINKVLKDILDKLNTEDKLNVAFTKLLKDMIKKTRIQPQCVDPLTDSASLYLENLYEVNPIKYPDEVFVFFISEKAQYAMNDQVNTIRLRIRKFLEQFKFQQIKYYLDQLKQLSVHLEMDQIKNVYEDSIAHINQHVQQKYDEIIEEFNKCYKNSNSLCQQDLLKYQKLQQKFQAIDYLRVEHLGDQSISSKNFEENIKKQFNYLIQQIKGLKDIAQEEISQYLEKIQLTAEIFSQFENQYSDIKLEIISEFYSKKSELQAFIDQLNILQYIKNCEIFQISITNIKEHVPNEILEQAYTDILDYFLHKLNNELKKITEAVDNSEIIDKDIEIIKSSLILLENVLNNLDIYKLYSKEQIHSIYEQCVMKVLEVCYNIGQDIFILSKSENQFDKVQKKMELLKKLRAIQVIEQRSSKIYYQSVEHVSSLITNLKIELDGYLQQLQRRDEQISYINLKRCLNTLRQAQWVSDFKEDVYKEIVEHVKQLLILIYNEYREILESNKIDLEHSANLVKNEKIVGNIQQIDNLLQMLPDSQLEGNIESVDYQNYFFDQVNYVLKYIFEEFQLEKFQQNNFQNLDFAKLEKVIVFNQQCLMLKNIHGKLKPEYQMLYIQLETLIIEFQKHSRDQVKQSLQHLLNYIELFDDEKAVDIQKLPSIMNLRMHEIIRLSYYQNVFDIYGEENYESLFKELKQCLNLLQNNLEDKMNEFTKTQNLPKMDSAFFVARIMIQMDEFMSEGRTYQSLYSNQQKIYYNDAPKMYTEIIQNIEKKNFLEVSNQMMILQNSKSALTEQYFKRASSFLINQLETLLEQTSNKVKYRNNIGEEKMETFVTNLKDVDKALVYLDGIIDIKVKEVIVKKKNQIISQIQKTIGEQLENIEQLIRIRNFEEVDIQLDKIENIYNMLDTYQSPEIEKKKTLLNQQQKNELQNVINSYKDIQSAFEYQRIKPKNLFKQISGNNYTNDRLILENSIRQTYIKEIDQLKLGQLSIQEKQKSLQRIGNTQKYLPQQISEEVTDLLNDFRGDIAFEYEQSEEILDELVKGKQFDNILNYIREKNDTIDSKLLQKLKEFIRKQMDQFYESIKIKIMTNNPKDALYVATSIFEFKQKFIFKFEAEIQEGYQEIQAKYLQLMEKVLSIVLKRFNNTELDLINLENVVEENLNDSRDSIKSYATNLDFFVQYKNNDETRQQPDKQIDASEAFQIIFLYLTLKSNLDSRNAVNDMFPAVSKQVSINFKKIISVIISEQNNFILHLSKFHIPELRTILYTMKKWNIIFININDQSNDDINLEENYKSLKEAINKLTYKQMLVMLSEKVQEIRSKLINDLSENKGMKLKKQIDEYYQQVNTNFVFMKNIDKLKEHSNDLNFQQIKRECTEAVQKRIDGVVNQFKEIICKESLNQVDCQTLSYSLNSMDSIIQNLDYQQSFVKEKNQYLQDEVVKKIHIIHEQAKINTDPKLLSYNLIDLKLLADNILPFKEQINEQIEQILLVQNKINKKNIVNLGMILDSHPIGKVLISEHKAFQGVQNAIFKSKSSRHSIETVLENIHGDEIDKLVLKSRYYEFNKKYREIILWYIKPENIKNLSVLVADTKLISKGYVQRTKIKWDKAVIEQIPIIAAHVFALYTLQNGSSYIDETQENQMDYLFTPHPAQIISIFRLLGVGFEKSVIQQIINLSLYDKNCYMQNNLIQIGTGEGKSVTLAIASSILALFGFDAYCACYSSYLSKRDYSQFSFLFGSLSISQKIHYGTFNEVCEKILNERFNIREKVQGFITSGTLTSPDIAKKLSLKVLLIDEVDVFLNKQFYGSIYSPSLTIQDPVIKQFSDFLWSKRHDKNIDLYQVQTSREFKELLEKYIGWDVLMLELLKEMILCLQSFESHSYVIHDKGHKIGYPFLDSVNYNAIQSYCTLFAYYLETERKLILPSSLEENIFLSVRCGEFSYAKIPAGFAFIMGVTGTLGTLNEIETQIIENEYDLKKKTFIPSVFGKNNLKFNENDIYIENKDDYFNVIKREIVSKLNPDPSQNIQRCVLVFFESKSKLMEFYNSPLYDMQDETRYLTEEADADEKDSIIKNASNTGQITLLTKSFGRGTDFIVRDDSINKNGGIHVIQTFLSEELSEETQIKGRTARQGSIGSFSMILLDQSLQLFNISLEELEDNKGKLSKLLTDKRKIYQLDQQKNNQQFVEKAQLQHDKSEKFLIDLEKNCTKEIKEYLQYINKGPQIQMSQSRTLCLIDATGSMGGLLSKVKTTVETMFQRANQTLIEGGFNPDSFLIKFAVFRNYPQNEAEILVSSGWESSPASLREFIQSISAFGGSGPGEAVEIGFQYALLEQKELKLKNQKIDQILLIGDAPSNTFKETINHRKSNYGEEYWKSTKFHEPGNIEEVVSKLSSQNVIINTFYLNQSAKASFTNIGKLGGGTSQLLEINSDQGAETLTNLVTIEILRKVGNQDGGSNEKGEKLAQAYKSKYLSYIS